VDSLEKGLFSKDLSEISGAHSMQEPGMQLLAKKKKINKAFQKEFRNETQIAEDGIAYRYKVRETDTASKVCKLRTLWGKGAYLMHPHKKKMVLAMKTTLKYLAPIFSDINTDFKFRFYDYALPLDV
jgi:hypothetical protein